MVLWFNVCNKELLALRNNFRVTKKFLIAKFDCTIDSRLHYFSIKKKLLYRNIKIQ
jgi:hypothetical protein